MIVSRCCPHSHYTPPVATAGEQRLHSSLLGGRHLRDGAQQDPESPLDAPGRGTARWLPSPPDPGTAITSLPLQHSRPGKHNPSTEAQLPHCSPSTAALPLSMAVPTAFPQLSMKPSSLTSCRAPLSCSQVSHTPCSLLCPCLAPQTQDKPCELSPTEPFPARPLPPGPAEKALPTAPHRSRTLRPPGSNIFGNITLELGGCWTAREGPCPRDPAAIALLFRSSVTRLAQGRGTTGPGRQQGPTEGYVHEQGVENVPASVILFVFQCETRSVICLKWLTGIFFFFFFFPFLFVKRG